MTRDEIEKLGSCYKSACRSKVLCYALAAKIAGVKLAIEGYGSAQQVELESLSDFHVGLLLADDWQVPGIPGEWLAEIQVIPSFSGSLEIH